MASPSALTPWFRNFYSCCCGAEWVDEWSCQCDDECPACGAPIEPYRSEDITSEGNA
jgi:hypothetical protein